MDRLTLEQVRRNDLTREAWVDYTPHRRIVTELLVRGRIAGRDRLCVVGAGNANDLDLALLSAVFREIHLVDVDDTALALGVARQGLTSPEAIELHGGIDVTGVLDRLADWGPRRPPADEEVDSCLRSARAFGGPALPAPFDVVASTCVLSQLIELVAGSLDASHPRFLELLLAVRDRHLQLLFEWLAPGGMALLVTDLVSSDSCPELAQVPAAEFGRLVAAQVARRNFFTGVNPQALKAWFQQDAVVRPLLERVELLGPWRWQIGPRTFAVCAFEAHRRPAS